jgi:hypothetical protein
VRLGKAVSRGLSWFEISLGRRLTADHVYL